jgi:Protein of unknown function (DUF2844)
MRILLCVVAALLLGTAPAWAVLGEYENSVTTDQQRVHGRAQEIVRQGYRIQEITAPNHTTIREYISPEGRVFGVSWQSFTMPNLQDLLGSYFAQFHELMKSQRRHRGPVIVRTDSLVVESGGHMRAFRGRAYAPKLMPASVTAKEVQ